ncbi:MAG: AarF/UbiB family protein [Patescibacteria group bacterium]|jgi:ubiquinone biosynthesis protein
MRIIQICWILSKYTVFYGFTSARRQNFGRRLKIAFEELGLTFIKIGQILSMRYDLLSRKDCESLQELLDRVKPIEFNNIVEIIKKEYGRPWREVFRVLEAVPLGSASVSQVHKAVLPDGSVVAVKVKRPGVDDKFLEDIKILKILSRVAALFSPTLRHVQITELVGQFESWIRQDLNFVLEAKNMRRIREQYDFGAVNFRSDLGKGVFMAPHENLCTENVVVMDFVDGIPMSRKDEILANPDYDIEKSLKTYINAAMRNWFRDDIPTYLFQGDPHLSNVMALPHGDVANIDCGLVSELSRKEIEMCKSLIIAVYLRDIERTVRIATQMTGVSYGKYAATLKPDLEIYLEQSQNEGLGFWFMEFTKIMIKHRIKFPLFLTTFGRTNLVLDGLARTYLPEQTTLDIVGVELKRQAIKETIKNITNGDWLRLAYALSREAGRTPEMIVSFLENPLAALSRIAAAVKTPFDGTQQK